MLPSVNFRSIRAYNGSQDRGFEELCFQLLPSLHDWSTGSTPVRHGTPDGGVSFDGLPDGRVWGWQAKYLFALRASEYGQLDESVKAALNSQPGLSRYTFCLPYNRPAGNVQDTTSALKRWEVDTEKWRGWAAERGLNVEFEYRGESELLAALSLPQHAGRAYYWFDATILTPTWFEDHLSEALEHAGPRYTPELNVELPLAFAFEGLGRTPAFQDRVREVLRDLRDKRDSWYALRHLGREDSALRAQIAAAESRLNSVDDLAMAVDVGRKAEVNIEGLVDACTAAEEQLRALTELLSERRSRFSERRASADPLEDDLAGVSAAREESTYASAWFRVSRTEAAVQKSACLAETDAARLSICPRCCSPGSLASARLTSSAMSPRGESAADNPQSCSSAIFSDLMICGMVFCAALHLNCTADELLGALSAAAEAAGCSRAAVRRRSERVYVSRVVARAARGVPGPNPSVPAPRCCLVLSVQLRTRGHPGWSARIADRAGRPQRLRRATEEAVRVFFDRFRLVGQTSPHRPGVPQSALPQVDVSRRWRHKAKRDSRAVPRRLRCCSRASSKQSSSVSPIRAGATTPLNGASCARASPSLRPRCSGGILTGCRLPLPKTLLAGSFIVQTGVDRS